jgi:hypothetical protein
MWALMPMLRIFESSSVAMGIQVVGEEKEAAARSAHALARERVGGTGARS